MSKHSGSIFAPGPCPSTKQRPNCSSSLESRLKVDKAFNKKVINKTCTGPGARFFEIHFGKKRRFGSRSPASERAPKIVIFEVGTSTGPLSMFKFSANSEIQSRRNVYAFLTPRETTKSYTPNSDFSPVILKNLRSQKSLEIDYFYRRYKCAK